MLLSEHESLYELPPLDSDFGNPEVAQLPWMSDHN